MEQQLGTRLDRLKIEKLTDRLLTERQNDLKRLLAIDHRLETVMTRDGIEWINDSKATTVGATLYSLQCMDKETVWIVDGGCRYMDTSALRTLASNKVKAVICIGTTDQGFVEEFVDIVSLVVQCDTLAEAVTEAAEMAVDGDAVLYSPATASYPTWENYRARGEAFRQELS